MSARTITYRDRQMQAEALAELVAVSMRAAIAMQGRVTLSVPGGSTPAAFLAALSSKALDWSAVTVLPNDERFVPEDHARSNARMIREAFSKGDAAAATYLSLYAEAETPEDALPALTQNLSEALPIDILILGMGEDMHTASLFPGADLLIEALSDDAPALLPMRAEGAGEPRITLTAPVLKAARETHLLISGAGKLSALNTALEDGPEAEAPVRAILRSSDPLIHFAH